MLFSCASASDAARAASSGVSQKRDLELVIVRPVVQLNQ